MAFVGAAAVTFAVLPHDSVRFWGDAIWHVNRLGHIATGGNQSINGALMRLEVADGPRTVAMLIGAALVGVLALWRGAAAARAGDWLTATVIVGAASVAMSPVSWTHHQVWLVLAAALPIRAGDRTRWIYAAAALAIMILPTAALGGLVHHPLGSLLGDLHLFLALAVACAIPYRQLADATSASPALLRSA